MQAESTLLCCGKVLFRYMAIETDTFKCAEDTGKASSQEFDYPVLKKYYLKKLLRLHVHRVYVCRFCSAHSKINPNTEPAV